MPNYDQECFLGSNHHTLADSLTSAESQIHANSVCVYGGGGHSLSHEVLELLLEPRRDGCPRPLSCGAGAATLDLGDCTSVGVEGGNQQLSP